MTATAKQQQVREFFASAVRRFGDLVAGLPFAAPAGHSQSTITDRYIHAAQVLLPGAAEKAEVRMFGAAG